MLKLQDQFQKIHSQLNNLPEKQNFKIGETAKLIGVTQHVLRYWEKEFPLLKPEKFTNNQRLYFKKDIELLLLIKYLLYKEKFSIEGLRKHLASYVKQLKQKKSSSSLPIEKKLHRLLHSISQIRDTIS